MAVQGAALMKAGGIGVVLILLSVMLRTMGLTCTLKIHTMSSLVSIRLAAIGERLFLSGALRNKPLPPPNPLPSKEIFAAQRNFD
jgi:hypothetical protein